MRIDLLLLKWYKIQPNNYLYNNTLSLTTVIASTFLDLPERIFQFFRIINLKNIPEKQKLLKLTWFIFRFVIYLLHILNVFELIDFLLNLLKPNSRKLNTNEYEMISNFFGPNIQLYKIRIDENSLLSVIGAKLLKSRQLGFVLFNSINFTRKINSSSSFQDQKWLIHEITHVYQMQKIGPDYILQSLHAQQNEGYSFNINHLNNPLHLFNFEQQAEIAKLLFTINNTMPLNKEYLIKQTEIRNGLFFRS